MRISGIISGAFGGSSWKTYAGIILWGAPVTLAFLLCGIALVDPYRVLPWSVIARPPIADDYQRYFFPMLVRTRPFDSYIFGSSTGMLVDPQAMGKIFGGRFANLALGDGRAWEQIELLRLARRQTPSPRTLIFSFDWVWCVSGTERSKLETERFPFWIYEDRKWSNLARLLNKTALEKAIKVARNSLLSRESKIRDDGYWVFTPPENTFDLKKTQIALYGDTDPEIARRARRSQPKETVTEAVRNSWKFPLLDALEVDLASLPSSTRVLLVGMPVHISAQPVPGSIEEAREQACKVRANEVAERHGTRFIDFRISSAVTESDENYWDPLHYRVGIARGLEQAIGVAAQSNKSDDREGFWRVFDADTRKE